MCDSTLIGMDLHFVLAHGNRVCPCGDDLMTLPLLGSSRDNRRGVEGQETGMPPRRVDKGRARELEGFSPACGYKEVR